MAVVYEAVVKIRIISKTTWYKTVVTITIILITMLLLTFNRNQVGCSVALTVF